MTQFSVNAEPDTKVFVPSSENKFSLSYWKHAPKKCILYLVYLKLIKSCLRNFRHLNLNKTFPLIVLSLSHIRVFINIKITILCKRGKSFSYELLLFSTIGPTLKTLNCARTFHSYVNTYLSISFIRITLPNQWIPVKN